MGLVKAFEEYYCIARELSKKVKEYSDCFCRLDEQVLLKVELDESISKMENQKLNLNIAITEFNARFLPFANIQLLSVNECIAEVRTIENH